MKLDIRNSLTNFMYVTNNSLGWLIYVLSCFPSIHFLHKLNKDSIYAVFNRKISHNRSVLRQFSLPTAKAYDLSNEITF